MLDFYLKVKTSVGNFHLPEVHREVKKNGLEVVFNWIVFEKDVILRSYQPFAEVEKPETDPEIIAIFPDYGTIEDYEVGEKVTLTPDDEMFCMPAHEIGCFVTLVPFAFVRELDPSLALEIE